MWLTFHRLLRALSRTNRRKASRRPRASTCRPRLEALEDRTLLSAYVVTTTADSGTGSLRDAITQINADTSHTLYASPSNPTVDEIDFNITAASDAAGGGTGYNSTTGVAAIKPQFALPSITNAVIINGYSQSGASENTLSNGDNSVLKIVLDGSNVPGTDYIASAGLLINANNSTVEGLAINSFGGSDIYATGNNDNFQGNFIGTDVSGTLTPFVPNLAQISASDHAGIQITGADNVIGTNGDGVNDPGERNIIAGNNSGVILRSTSNSVVAGNFIGTDATGTHALPNWIGIGTLLGANGDRIGTNGTHADAAGERNIISGNAAGIAFGVGGDHVSAETNGVVAGNSIGVDVNGTPLGNRVGVFVAIDSTNITIGGSQANLANTIANTQGTGPGVWILDFRGAPTGIRVQGNSIYNNGGLGIALGGTYPTPPVSVTLNDSASHVGPNNFQNFPILSSASSSSTSTSITGTFSEAAEGNKTITLDFYANSIGSSTTYGQGQIYLGSRTVVTDVSGKVSFNAAFALGNLAGDWISATATDQDGNTSEFSQDIQAGSAPGQTFTQSLPAALPQSTTSTNTLIIQADTTTINDVVTALSPSNLGSSVVPVSVYLNLAPGTYTATTVQIPAGMTLYINGTPGTTIDPDLPAFTLASGNVVVSNVTFLTTGDAPTIRVTGGSLTLRNDTIQESTGYNDAAIEVTGGTVDLGNATDPGGNTININGAGAFVHNTTSTPITAVGDTFTLNGLPLTPSSLSGTVFEDFNDNGQIDFGEQGIANVLITLTGTDDLGDAVSQSRLTDADGAYVFLNLRPGNYTITETQPAGYAQGIDSVGTAGGSLSATDQFFANLAPAVNGENYNFGEQPSGTGPVQKGQTAGIGFWNNKNGQALILAFNGGTGTQLADWLAAALPNMFGANAGSNDLAGQSNAYVAALFQSDFVVKGTKVDAQVLATALSVYATNATLDNTQVATAYGFTVSGDGVGAATVNVGSNGDAFGVANNTTMTVMDLLLATDAQTIDGLLYDGNKTRRNEANAVYSAINEAGSIS
ncbi:MAG TPA: SdrD B-like domain-containing protein [Gemmataceae bacterium]|jgi:hypothetical protein